MNVATLNAVAVAQADAEAAKQEYRSLRLTAIKPVVAQYLAENRPDLGYDAAIALVSAFLVDHNQRATDANIVVAIAQAHVQPKRLSEAEERAQIEAEIAALKGDVRIPTDWSDRDKKAKLEGIRMAQEADHNRFAATFDDATAHNVGRVFMISTEQMRQELQNLKSARAYRSMSHQELKEEVKSERVPPGVTPIPERTPILSPSISRHALVRYSKDEIAKLKRAFDQRHGIGAGDTAINARLSGADADEIKAQYGI